MSFDDVLNRTLAMLRERGRVSYRALRREFGIADDGLLDDLKFELIDVLKVARDEDGTMLAWTGPPAAPPARPAVVEPRPAPAPDGERRFLTVLFCDLVDATPLSERLDPEQLAEVYRAWQDACVEVIQRFGGHIAEYRGDGAFIYFGYPQAFEDAPQRAIRTGFGILERLQRVNADLERSHGVSLSVRIGVHSGLVLLSNLGGHYVREQFAVGETPNLAARVQALAGAGELLVSDAVHAIARDAFEFDDLGARTLKGITRPVRVFRALRETRQRGSRDGTRTALVGRDSELALLRDRWALAMEGHGRVVMLGGEAGIGKSRLVAEHKAHAEALGGQRVVLRCSAYHAASALYPVVDHLQRLLHLDAAEPVEPRLQRLRQCIADSGADDVPSLLALVAPLLGLPGDEPEVPASPLLAQQRRQRTIEALVGWMRCEARRQPLLLVCEDLHWADPSSLEMLQLLIDEMADARLMVLMTFRPEFQAPWPNRSHVSHVTLGRLSDADAHDFARRALRGRALAVPALEQIVARADGVPLFIEELISTVAARGADGVAPPPIPDTLQGSLMARLDRLAEVREIAQLGAAIGREFDYSLIRAVAQCDEAELRAALGKLVDSELLQRRGALPEAVYRFRHALIRDAAYESTLRARRQQMHRRIADALEHRFPAQANAHPELLAQHCTEAGDADRAVRFWSLAGERALNRCANEEALSHLGHGLALLQRLPASPQRAQRELRLEVARGAALLMARGQSAPEVEQAYANARRLGVEAGDSEELFPVLMGLWRFYLGRGANAAAREVAEKMFGLAERLQDQDMRLGAHMALGITLYHQWEMPRALELVRAGAELYERDPPDDRATELFSIGQHPGLGCNLCIAFIGWLVGDDATSRRWQQRALDIARRLGSPFQLVSALSWSAMMHWMRGDLPALRTDIDAAAALSDKYKFPVWAALASVHRGALQVADGAHSEGLALARSGVAMIEQMLYGLLRVRGYVVLADSCRVAGRIDEGLEAVGIALDIVRQAPESWWEPELHRLRGELLLGRPGGGEAAEASFREALRIATHSGLAAFEQRAGQSLARLRGAAPVAQA